MSRSAKRIILVLSIIIVALAAILVIILMPQKVNVFFITPDGSETLSVNKNKLFDLPEANTYPGYTFLGWYDENDILAESPMCVSDDTYFSAKYGLSIADGHHTAFLSAENAFFRPSDTLTIRDAVTMIYSLLDTDLKGTSSFLDIDSTDEIYEAASLLKDLGIFTGNYLHPEDYLSELDFYNILSNFYPADRLLNVPKSADFLLTREQTAVIMCSLLNRYGDSAKDTDKVGEISDVPSDSENYWLIAEACVPHKCSNSGTDEIWTESTPCIQTENGFYFVGYDLHYIDSNGHSVKDTSIGSIIFDSQGIWTSGDPALDQQIRDILKQNVDPQSQTRLEMLHILYNYVRDNFGYCYGNDHLPGETGWANAEAVKMLERGIGNCYRFAGLFAVLSRSIGFDAEECCGVMDKDVNLHSWVEINIDGTQYLFDPQYEARFPIGAEGYDRYMQTGSIFDRYNAMREYRDKYN